MPGITAINRVTALKKRLVLVLGSITLTIGSAFFLVGKFIQLDYYDAVDKLNAKSNFKLQVASYDRGIFHSYVQLNLQIPGDNAHPVPIQQTITHGPFIAVNTTHGISPRFIASQIETTFGKDWQEKLIKLTGNQKPLTFTTAISFSNQATSWIKLAPIDRTAADNSHIVWSAIQGELQHDLSFANYTGSIAAPKVSISSPTSTFTINDMTLKLQAANEEPNFLHTDTFNTKLITYAKADVEIIRLEDINVTLQLDKNADNNIDINLLANVAKSLVYQQNFAQDQMKFIASNVKPANLLNLPKSRSLSPQTAIDFAQQMTADPSTKLNIELPKHFTEALLSYVSYEIYKQSLIGSLDKRSDLVILQDITNSINKIVRSALNQKLFVDQGEYYALNFDPKSPKQS